MGRYLFAIGGNERAATLTGVQGVSTFSQGTFVGSFIIVAVLFERFRARSANE